MEEEPCQKCCCSFKIFSGRHEIPKSPQQDSREAITVLLLVEALKSSLCSSNFNYSSLFCCDVSWHDAPLALSPVLLLGFSRAKLGHPKPNCNHCDNCTLRQQRWFVKKNAAEKSGLKPFVSRFFIFVNDSSSQALWQSFDLRPPRARSESIQQIVTAAHEWQQLHVYHHHH